MVLRELKVPLHFFRELLRPRLEREKAFLLDTLASKLKGLVQRDSDLTKETEAKLCIDSDLLEEFKLVRRSHCNYTYLVSLADD